MEKLVYCLKDTKAGFLSPTLSDSDATAIRSFSLLVNDKRETLVAQCPEDFELYALGSFDSNTGILHSSEPRFVARGADVKKVGDVNA